MKFMGSKNRISKHILPIMVKERKKGQCWVEPFVGGANMIDKVDGYKIGSDSNFYLIEMWKSLVSGWVPQEVTRGQYVDIRDNKSDYRANVVGWAGFNCSYSGKWFGGFAGRVNTKIGTIRNYQKESIRNVLKQVPLLYGTKWYSEEYNKLKIPKNSLIYCDPPYRGTTKYNNNFNHDEFWQWCRAKTSEGHVVFVSEYSAPNDFRCLWEMEVGSSLSANGKHGSRKQSVEKLFRYREYAPFKYREYAPNEDYYDY